MFLSIMLIFYGAIALYIGVSYFTKEKKQGIIRNCLLCYGIFVFMWCFGYGMMGLSKTVEHAYFWRSFGLFGVVFYLFTNFIYVRFFTGLFKDGFEPVAAISLLFTLVTFFLTKQENVVTFFEYNGRMAYSSQPCLGRTIESLFIIYIIAIPITLGIIMYRNSTYRRTKNAILILLLSHFAIVLLMIPDTIFPMMGKVSMPTTGFGAFISYLCIMYVMDTKATFTLSTTSMNEFMFKNIDSCILFFDPDGIIIAANEYAKDYLEIYGITNLSFTTLFDLTREDVTKMLEGRYQTTRTGIGVKLRWSDKTCSASVTKMVDKYGDPMYYACILNDITSEANLYDETNSLKEQLDIEVKKKTREIELLSLQTIETMANTLEAKDEYTKGHSSRVSEYSVLLAKRLGFDDAAVENLRVMALLHDVGKIAIPDRVLNKAGRLEDDEFDIIKSHTTQGDTLLRGISSLGPVASVARHHHERYDGKGYPDHISGEDIELEARIVGIADAYDAMSSDRVYRRALPKDVIREELIKGRGTQFDPNLLDVFLEMFNNNELDHFAPKSVLNDNQLNLSDVLKGISDEGVHDGANTLSHDELVKLYSYLKDRNSRYGSDFRVILINLCCSDESSFNPKHMEKAMAAMEYSIVQYLRKTDLTSRVSPTQQIVVLTEANDNYISTIIERIFAGYYRNCLYTEIKPAYEIDGVIDK